MLHSLPTDNPTGPNTEFVTQTYREATRFNTPVGKRWQEIRPLKSEQLILSTNAATRKVQPFFSFIIKLKTRPNEDHEWS